MLLNRFPLVLVLLFGLVASADAQFREGDPDAGDTEQGDVEVQHWQVGMTVKAGGFARGIVGYTVVPMDWPEQEVRIVDEEISANARVRYEMSDGMARIMVIRIPSLRAGEEATALVTLEVRRRAAHAPKNTDQYTLPELRKLSRGVRLFLGTSPLIETRHRSIRKLAAEIGVDEAHAWDRVEAIYDWVREKVEYQNGPIKGALAALEDETGDCEELTSLFIAICRAGNIPARTVWVPGHCYPEFYLCDAEGKGHWFPCQAAGSRAFGGIPEHRPILQKGDNVRPPYDRRERKRYLANHMTAADVSGKPTVKFVRKTVTH